MREQLLARYARGERDFTGSDLRGVDLRGADLRGAKLGGGDLRGVIFRECELAGAKFVGSDLREADLSCADLTGADLYASDVRGADLSGADLINARFDGALYDDDTRWPDGVTPSPLADRVAAGADPKRDWGDDDPIPEDEDPGDPEGWDRGLPPRGFRDDAQYETARALLAQILEAVTGDRDPRQARALDDALEAILELRPMPTTRLALPPEALAAAEHLAAAAWVSAQAIDEWIDRAQTALAL